MFSEPPMMPMPNFDMYDDTRQTPMSSTTTPGTPTVTRIMKLHLVPP